MPSLEQQLLRVDSGLPMSDAPQFSQSVHWGESSQLPVHRWFRYREGFSPRLLDYFPGSKNRLDPFCGCGTTLLESARTGVRSFGIDLNPLATYVTEVKTREYSQRNLIEFRDFSKVARTDLYSFEPAIRPQYDLLDKLFLDESLDTLLRIRACLETAPTSKVRDLLFLAWLSILEDSSNVYKEGNGLKYRNKLRRPGTYATIPDSRWIPHYFGDSITEFVLALWALKCMEMADDIERSHVGRTVPPRIRTGSCLDAQNLDFGEKIDFVVFSPPYANRFDYFEAFKIELWMGGFVNNKGDMSGLRSGSMRSNLAAPRTFDGEQWEWLEPILNFMDPEASSVRMGIKNALRGYFMDMRSLLRNLKRVLARNSMVVIIVGNSAYAKSIIPTDALISRVGVEEGYRLSGVCVARHLHVSSQQRASLNHLHGFMRESVIVLETA